MNDPSTVPSQPPDDSADKRQQRPTADGRSPAILFVDDDARVCEIARLLLESAGYTVLEAARGREALKVFEQNADRIGLLITDIAMPEMDGGELAIAVRSLRPNVRILYISGYDYAVMELPSEATGAFLQKPLTKTTLVGKVRDLLKEEPAHPPAEVLIEP